MKYDYLQSFRVPFIRRVFWRRISRDHFLNRVRHFYFNTSDEDIMIFFESDPTLAINTGKNTFRVQVRKS